jgi:hypothetical protein
VTAEAEPEETAKEKAANKMWLASAELVRVVGAYTRACDHVREAAEAALAVGYPVKDVPYLALPDMPEMAMKALSGIIKSAAADRKADPADLMDES